MGCLCMLCLRPEWPMTDEDMEEFEWDVSGFYAEISLRFNCEGRSQLPARMH